ncbi:hypothetical protein M407DRAFT_26973 [Tulasnella calospora MUT 4182]|uniref:Uncharacterized protein n=1 Tax=Tulasnella calospora MUT 4182 TaxID=1051891 RepID=A0A0C3QDD1_9AGAM|nr:hypothetical protein M407DRAFT_26973 [Tulasnella calospora MUT 4182]
MADSEGIDGNECEAFIIAIRDLAFAKGKEEDCHWMLHYATTWLRGKALRWHAKLDPSIQKDWDLFVQALFEEYPFVEEQDEGGIATPVWTSTTFSPASSTITLPGNDCHLTTAKPMGTEAVTPRRARLSSSLHPGGGLAPPSRVYDSSLPGYQMDHLLVIYEAGRLGPHYISTSKQPTSNVHEALVVTFIPSSRPHYIACFNSRREKLCVNLWSPDRSELHYLTGTTNADQPISVLRSNSQRICRVWSISPDGMLNATLPDLVPNPRDSNYSVPSEYYLASTVYVEISGESISFAKDYSTARPGDPFSGFPIVRARIVFEPL